MRFFFNFLLKRTLNDCNTHNFIVLDVGAGGKEKIKYESTQGLDIMNLLLD